MSDFLSRLIDRSTGTALVAKPVIPPLFAPGPPAQEASADAWSTQQPAPTADPPAAHHPEPKPPAEAPVDWQPMPPTVPARAEPIPAGPVAEAIEPRMAAVDTSVATRVPRELASAEPIAPLSERRRLRVSTLRPAEAASPTARGSTESIGSDSAEGAPVVLVRIGRIEVRATTPAEPPRPQAPRKPPAVSLEDYLRPRRRSP